MVGFRLKVKPKLPPLIQQVLEKRFLWFAGHGQFLSLSSPSKMSRPESSSPPACLDRLLCITRAATRWSRSVKGFLMQMSPSLLRNGGSQLRSVAISVEYALPRRRKARNELCACSAAMLACARIIEADASASAAARSFSVEMVREPCSAA